MLRLTFEVLFVSDRGIVVSGGCFFSGSFLGGNLFLSCGLFNGSFLGGFFSKFSLFGNGLFDDIVAALAGAGCQQILLPGDDLIAVGSDHIDSTGNSGQSGQNFQNSFHRMTSLN